MRIIAKKKDYYDCIMRNGIDPSIVYVREETEEIFPPEKRNLSHKEKRNLLYNDNNIILPFYASLSSSAYDNIFDYHYIGFCGKVYPFLTYKNEHFYTLEKALQFIKMSKREQNATEKFFNINQNDFKKFFKHPIFHMRINRYNRNSVVTYNPLLNQYHFYKVLEPNQAFQQLQQYISNIAKPEKVPWKISDELMAQSKGFNKFSFRKDKTKK